MQTVITGSVDVDVLVDLSVVVDVDVLVVLSVVVDAGVEPPG